MSGIGLTQVPTQPRRGWLAAGATVAGLAIVGVVGYGLLNRGGLIVPGGSAAPTPVLTDTRSPASTPGPTPTSTPTLGPGMATGTQTCGPSTGDVTVTVDQVVQTRGGVLECTDTSTDPRLAGASTVTMDYDEHPDGRWLARGTIEVRNDSGTWSGTYTISSSATAGSMEFDAVLIGSGGYAGLEVLNHVRVMVGRTTITSRVFEAGLAVAGTETCTKTAIGRTLTTSEASAYRGVILRCTDTMADSRLSGTRTLQLSIDMRADDSADIWGTAVLENADGSWEGSFFGTVDPGYTTHRVEALMRGSGAYEGLLFRLKVVGDGTNFDLTGEVIPAG